MKNVIIKLILVIAASVHALSAIANGDDEKNPFKNSIQHRSDFIKSGKILKIRKPDSLIFTKNIDDTLTFENEKTADDTLIFADDEMKGKIKPATQQIKSAIDPVIIEKTEILYPVIYPNPSFGQSVIEMNVSDYSTTEITICSVEGNFIKKEIAYGKRYQINDLATGTYIVTIQIGKQIIHKRLFVK